MRKHLLRRLLAEDSAGSTVEWLLVACASLILFSAGATLINVLINVIFTRIALIISTPFG